MTNMLCAIRCLLIAGFDLNYQQAGDVVLAPVRAGVGLRVGSNIGYLHYARENFRLPL